VDTDKRGKGHRFIRIGIKWKMFAILVCFVSLFLVVQWIFQVQMLNLFYQTAKLTELEDTAVLLSEVLDNENALSSAVEVYAKEYYNDIWLYKVSEDGSLSDYPIASASGINDDLGIFLEGSFDQLFQRAVETGGSYTAMIPMKNFKERYFEFKIHKDNYQNPNQRPLLSGNIQQFCAMHVSIHKTDVAEYVIIQRGDITPLGSMVHTLENQVLFTGVLLLVLTLLLAVMISKLITTPIVHISNSAKRLAAGKYDVEFSGHGYREIEELSDTLNFAANELSKNDKLQKELISNVSHDLRTPLTMIKGYGEMMRDIPGENTPENVQIIVDEAARLTDLVNDMMDLSKIRAGARVPDMREFCLTELLQDTMFRYERLIKQDGYKIDLVADKNVYVFADSVMILQVIYNLINNAINYTGDDKYVRVEQIVIEDTVRISVTDTGSGIAEEDIPYIWDRYYKVDKVHKRATVGTGLGLSIVKGVLELHNATYGVDSRIDSGSTFWFELKTSDSDEYKAEIVEL